MNSNENQTVTRIHDQLLLLRETQMMWGGGVGGRQELESVELIIIANLPRFD